MGGGALRRIRAHIVGRSERRRRVFAREHASALGVAVAVEVFLDRVRKRARGRVHRRLDHLHERAFMERAQREELEENRAERIDVAPRVDVETCANWAKPWLPELTISRPRRAANHRLAAQAVPSTVPAKLSSMARSFSAAVLLGFGNFA